MFIAALFTIAKTWNQPKCPSMIDWTGKMWHIYTMEYYAAIRNDEFVSFMGTWMNVENILSKLTQEQKRKYHVLTHRWVLNNENTGTQGGEYYTLGSIAGIWGEIAWGEMPDTGEGGGRQRITLPLVYLHNYHACSSLVPQKLKCN